MLYNSCSSNYTELKVDNSKHINYFHSWSSKYYCNILVRKLLALAHDASRAGHFGEFKTLDRLSKFFWRRKTRDVQRYVKRCLDCQKTKDSNKNPFTDPMVLERPTRRWGSISMDFIQGLPETKKRSQHDSDFCWPLFKTASFHIVSIRDHCSRGRTLIPRSYFPTTRITRFYR